MSGSSNNHDPKAAGTAQRSRVPTMEAAEIIEAADEAAADDIPGVDAPPAPLPGTELALHINNVTVDFDGFKALGGVDLRVQRGELRFLIGPNGAGKTTLIDIITGLAKPTTGTVHFNGQDITRLREHRRVRLGIGRSFQTPTVFGSLTVVENVDLAASFRRPMPSLFLRRHGMSSEVAAAIERVGLMDVSHRLAGQLSHGQKQWLEIGMLLAQRPQLLLLDEPVAGMSTEERLATGELLHELAGDHTIIVIDHDMAFLRRFARKVTVLHEGKILAEGSVAEVQADDVVREVYLG
ncbi:MAG: urea ABC transporter ATP-binding protein UrtD, partial [Ilumatobacteraceae bacterium]